MSSHIVSSYGAMERGLNLLARAALCGCGAAGAEGGGAGAVGAMAAGAVGVGAGGGGDADDEEPPDAGGDDISSAGTPRDPLLL